MIATNDTDTYTRLQNLGVGAQIEIYIADTPYELVRAGDLELDGDVYPLYLGANEGRIVTFVPTGDATTAYDVTHSDAQKCELDEIGTV